MLLGKLSFKQQLLLLIIIPLVGYILFAGNDLAGKLTFAQQMDTLTKHIQLASMNSSLVHELQKERGNTAGFLGSNGTQFRQSLIEQRQSTDRAINARNTYLATLSFINQPVLKDSLNKVSDELTRLTSNRQRIDALDMPLNSALAYYTNLNKHLLVIATHIAKQSHNAQINQLIIAYDNFLQAKERAGIERAVLANVFATNQFSPGLFVKFLNLINEQDTYTHQFEAFADQSAKQFMVDTMNDSAIDEVKRLRQVAIDNANTGPFKVDSTYWFEQATRRINFLKRVEDFLNQQILNKTNELKSQAQGSLISNALIVVTLLIALGLCTFLILNLLNKQVRSISSTLSNVTHRHQLNVRAQVFSQNDLGQIADDLNNMLEVFSDTIKKIAHASTDLASTSEHTSSAIKQSQNLLSEQQMATVQIATAIEQMVATTRDVAQNIVSASDSAASATRLTEHGQKVVDESGQSIASLANDVSHLGQRIAHLHDSSNNITKMIDIIKAIAEQTNLLALNAAIEAARAGEQGRGFAVVADEVRTLAKRTQVSTHEIEQIITTLQADANSAFELAEISQQKAADAVTKAGNVETLLTDVSQSIGTIDDLTDQIAAAAEQQVSVNEEISRNVLQVEQKAQQTVSSNDQVAETAQSQSQLALRLKELSGLFAV
ncbi:methyl-accepting chemotaxis protein [Neptunicella sp. SCSIO 80796]|uniref:methyl-accepting chemotaxis protein n=1 Tax=Neptunicella plasticusilytica TaxID=3117012 RepID=UPI003A4D6EB4